MKQKLWLVLTIFCLVGAQSYAQKAIDVETAVKKADAAWAIWQGAREKVESTLTQDPWETDIEFQKHKSEASFKASAKEMAAFDKAIADLRAGSYSEPSANIALKVEVDAKDANIFYISIEGKNGALAYEGRLSYKAKKASEGKLLSAPEKLKVNIPFKLFPIGDFGGRYREVARRIDIGGISIDVLNIKDFASGMRDKAERAQLFETVFVEGGSPVIDPFHFSVAGKVTKGPESFYTTTTMISQDVFTQVTGISANLIKKDRFDPWRAVRNVTWNESVLFCNALSKLDGLDPVFTLDSQDRYVPTLSSNGWRMQSFEEFYYASVGGPKARYRAQVGGDGPGFVGNDLGQTASLVGDSSANELGIRDIFCSLQFWETVGNRFDTKTTFYLQSISSFGGNFDLGANLRFDTFSFRIQRRGVAK